MKIYANGKAVEIPEPVTIDGFLNSMAIDRQYVAVALNREFVARSLFFETIVCDGDELEIVSPMAGG